MGITVIERVKIQAQVLVPLVKALQAELGEERANALVRKTLGDIFRRLGQQWWQSKQSEHVGDNMASAIASWARLGGKRARVGGSGHCYLFYYCVGAAEN